MRRERTRGGKLPLKLMAQAGTAQATCLKLGLCFDHDALGVKDQLLYFQVELRRGFRRHVNLSV